MERWSLVLKIVLLTTGLMFLLRTFMLQSLQDQIASLLFGAILVSIYIYMLIVIPSFICLEKDQLVIKRVFGKKCIPYSCIKNAFVYDGVQNVRAREIYRKYGFVENGEMCGDEIIAVYDL